MNKEEIKEVVQEILDKNYSKFMGSNEAEIHSCYDIAEFFYNLSKPLIAEIAELKVKYEDIRVLNVDLLEDVATLEKQLKASKSEATTNELELSVRIRQYIEKTHESDITPESLTKVFLDNYKPKLEANEVLIDVDKNTDSDTWFINNLIGLAHTKLALLKENKIESIDRIELSNWINKHIKQAKSEANEAVEFAYFILDNYTQNTIGWHHNNWSGDLETYVNYSPKQLYEIFKTRNNK